MKNLILILLVLVLVLLIENAKSRMNRKNSGSWAVSRFKGNGELSSQSGLTPAVTDCVE